MSAVFSPCGRYRYTLRRDLGSGDGTVLFVMLNPSTADAERDDPTVRRCIGYAQRWGFARLLVGNAYAWRATDPRELRRCADPVGPHNDAWLRTLAESAQTVVFAWGAHATPERAAAVELLVRAERRHPMCLGHTKAGAPKHPLYLRSDERPVHYAGAAR